MGMGGGSRTVKCLYRNFGDLSLKEEIHFCRRNVTFYITKVAKIVRVLGHMGNWNRVTDADLDHQRVLPYCSYGFQCPSR